nr:hypothetical protein CR513_16880 [Ipomoea batatas]
MLPRTAALCISDATAAAVTLAVSSANASQNALSAVTSILPSATSLGMGFPIRLHGVAFRALVAFPLLLAVFPAEVLLYSASMAGCGLSCEAADSDLSETLSHIFHTNTYLLPSESLVTRLSLQLQDLPKPNNPHISNERN